jgi:proline iminopeptidase
MPPSVRRRAPPERAPLVLSDRVTLCHAARRTFTVPAGPDMKRFLPLSSLLALCACSQPATPPAATPATAVPAATEVAAGPAPASAAGATTAWFDNSGRDDLLTGGVKMVQIDTPKGKFHVWTKRVGNNPRIKVLLLHGGPAATHEMFEVFDSYFPGAGIEYYYYDQLGSDYSDQPDDPALWTTDRFVEEVEQVRSALHLDKDNFYLYGQSWGGLLGMEYALKHQDHLKGLIVSDMMSSIPAYNKYAHDVLMPAMDQKALAEIQALEKRKDYDNPRYEELLMNNFYNQHILRLPPEQWPEPVLRAFKHLNKPLYTRMQGPSEMGASGVLENWDRSADLGRITVPTLVIGAQYDTMDPAHMEWMAKQMPHARYLYVPDAGHFAQYDNPQVYFTGLVAFLKDVDAGRF